MSHTWFKLLATSATSILLMAMPAMSQPVSFKSKDNVKIFANFEPAKGKTRGIVLLFHMAGSNKGEYAPLAPTLNRAGFATLAIDQRAGGDRWGEANQTAARAGGNPTFADAIPDLEAALTYAVKRRLGPIVLWGSSYSSALVFIVAARHPEVKALLAFSPAEYIEGYSISKEAAALSIPVYITSARDQSEVDSARLIANAISDKKAKLFVPDNGAHGSATLRVDVNPGGASENWREVMTFLDDALPAD